SAIVEAVDWSNAEERTVVLDEFNFTPANLTFKINQPYELTLSNGGGVGHNFVSSAFFDSIAVKGLVFADGEVNLPLLESVALETGESKILIFVPLTAGTFPLVCDQPLHETFGMEGMITIE
ncbi:MAG: cupredoxin domain-containing protein, partial [Alphaproteobacteria bacterium]|nr:cupredoxin domain-containing protein [Alphaproteobacteria bacterium]